MPTISTQPAIQTQLPVSTPKTAAPETKKETPALVKDIKKDDVSLSSQARGVSKLITIPGAAVAGGVVGGATGATILGIVDIAAKGGAFKEAVQAGGLTGAMTGVVTGAAVAHMAKNKTQATLYGALAGAGTGAVSGAAGLKTLPGALFMGAVGAVSGAVSGFTTSYLLGK